MSQYFPQPQKDGNLHDVDWGTYNNLLQKSQRQALSQGELKILISMHSQGLPEKEYMLIANHMPPASYWRQVVRECIVVNVEEIWLLQENVFVGTGVGVFVFHTPDGMWTTPTLDGLFSDELEGLSAVVKKLDGYYDELDQKHIEALTARTNVEHIRNHVSRRINFLSPPAKPKRARKTTTRKRQ